MKVVVLTGAGMSAESGVSTFRDSDGLWEQYNVEDVATPEGWARNPQMVTDFYNNLRTQILQKEPCLGHKLVAELEKQYEVTVVTQNVDDLHERAGSTNVIHLHGELMKVTSSRNPNDPRYIQTLDKEHLLVKMGDCAQDGSQLRPFIVWFGEPVPNMPIAMNMAFEADVFVVIGTSLLVSPANTLIACSGTNHNIVIDPGEVEIPEGFLQIKETATVGMEMLYQSLMKLAQRT